MNINNWIGKPNPDNYVGVPKFFGLVDDRTHLPPEPYTEIDHRNMLIGMGWVALLSVPLWAGMIFIIWKIIT